MDKEDKMDKKKRESPVLFGMILILFFTIILSGSVLGLLYWKNLSDVARTKQIACPLNKFCPAGTNDAGYTANVRIVFPTFYDDLTDGEYITFPYYDSFDPTLKYITVGFDTSTTIVPVTDTSYLDITGIGYTEYDISASPNITVYVNGLSGYSDISNFLASLVREALIQSTSPIKKKAFMEMVLGTQGGNEFLDYRIKVFGFSEKIGDLTVTSSVNGSIVLSGTSTLIFEEAPTVNPPGVVDVYQDMNALNVLQIAPSLAGAKGAVNNCVEPSFNAAPCANKVYSTEYGVWVDPEWDPTSSSVPPTILDDWSVFQEDVLGPTLPFCAKNLDQTVPNKADTNNTYGVLGGSGLSGTGGYQTIGIATGVTNSISSAKSPVPFQYTNPDKIVIPQANYYDQNMVFCGSANKLQNNLQTATGDITGPTLPPGSGTKPYTAVYPNPNTNTATNPYTNLGWPTGT